ncbi:MAG: hypothetical protein ACR2KJ_16105 [Jatrophihabitans sp.]
MTDPGMGVLTAEVSRQAADLSLYAAFVSNTLAAGLPGELVQVQRQRSRFGRAKDDAPVLAVSVQLGDYRYTLRRAKVGATAEPTVAHVVRDVVLSSNPVAFTDWCQRVADGLDQLSKTNQATADALARITGFQV